MGEKGEGSGGKGGGNWEWGTPLSTPSVLGERLLISSLPGKAFRTLFDIRRLAE